VKTTCDDHDGSAPPPPRLLSPYRPMNRMPTALLRTCRQVYAEARAVPFHENEFVFAGLFSSGAATARAFTRALCPWQRAAMRFVRLELAAAADFCGDGGGAPRWADLCGMWAEGLRGLRIRVAATGVPVGAAVEEEDGGGGVGVVGPSQQEVQEPARWIDWGLLRLRALAQLEVELTDARYGEREALAWCAGLERRLNEGRGETGAAPVRVICVQKTCAPPPRKGTAALDTLDVLAKSNR